MVLHGVAHRSEERFRFVDAESLRRLPASARALIGDGRTAALVRVDGAIDWLCFPRFDAPSVFGALLDPARGGLTSLSPVSFPFESVQAYDPDTNVLETLHTVAGEGVLRVTDFMPWTDDPRATVQEIHRRVECREGAVEVEVVFDPRFDYGRAPPTFETTPVGVLASAGSGRLAAVLGNGARWQARPEGGVRARFWLRAGEHAWLVLSWDAPTPEPLSAHRPFEQLRATRRHWREWTRQLRYDGPFRHHVVRSALALKLLIYAPTGAMVAAPTASLPEWLGGGRNWDYRYTWTRDTAMAIRAATRIGYVEEARDFFHFVRDSLAADPKLQVVYAVDGARVPEERALDHLAGFRDSRPVRIGNAARDQLQLDAAGALLDAASMYESSGGSLGLGAWRHLRSVVDWVARDWKEPDHGIWEPRSGKRHNVHSKLMSWVALDSGQRLAALFGETERARAWVGLAQRVREEVLARGLDASGKHFVSAYDGDAVDAALLLLPLQGFVPADDPRSLATIAAVRERLGSGRFLHRYRTSDADDGVGGPEGAFVLCGFWLAEALAQAGRVDDAQEVFLAHVGAANHVGLLSEEVDPERGTLLGNFPQAFSHLGLINAALGIDRALRVADELAMGRAYDAEPE
jgi:GH15 family glucan-1,4-alpha-glucosidase